MADLSDVEIALRDLVTAAVYPNGVPSAPPGTLSPSPIVRAPVKSRRGWPDAAKLDADLLAGVVNVTVFSMPGHSRALLRYIDDWNVAPSPAPTMLVLVAGQVATFSGVGGAGQIAGVQLADGTAYAVHATGSPADTAAALATVVPGAAANGPTLTLPGAFVARTGGPVTEVREVRRQIQAFRITVWAPTEPLRDLVSETVDLALAEFDDDWLTLSDGTGGLLHYAGTQPDDAPTKANLWKRDLEYTVEYATVARRVSPPILFPFASVTRSA